MFLSSFKQMMNDGDLILTAPIHWKGSISE